jgi:hypothetical protein
VRLAWSWAANRPLFENAMPVRLMAYASLAAAVMAALWASSRFGPAWLRAGLVGLAVLALVPNVSWSAWSRTPQVPRLFSTSLYKSCLGRGENVLLLPFGTNGDAELWQVRSGFWFNDAGGYVSPYPPRSYTRTLGEQQVATEKVPPDVGTPQVLELVRLEHATAIVVSAPAYSLWAGVLRPFGRPQEAGGAFIYRLRGALPQRAACAAAS